VRHKLTGAPLVMAEAMKRFRHTPDDRPLLSTRVVIVILAVDLLGFGAALALLQPILPYLYRETETPGTAIEAFIAICFVVGAIPALGVLLIVVAPRVLKSR
jgi:hypothetical protein